MTYIAATKETVWRATGIYSPKLASKSSLVEEARLFLTTYAQSGETRTTIVGILRTRLVRWKPPSWVLDDLVTFACDANPDTLRLALLLHTARQDRLLYDFVQQVIVPRRYSGIYKVIRSDVQGFLDKAQEEHSEVLGWSYTTRQRLSNSVLTVLRDCRLLKGEANKHIGAPYVPMQVGHHLVHLLIAEGIAEGDMVRHPDWQLWLWDEEQVRKAIAMVTTQEHMAWRTA